jgi:hypothetical protein
MICVLRCVYHVYVCVHARLSAVWHVWLDLTSLLDGVRFECAFMVCRSRGVFPSILNLGASRRLVGQLHAPADLSSGDELPVPIE